LRPPGERAKFIWPPVLGTMYGLGKFIIQYKELDGEWTGIYAAISYDRLIDRLATGKLELEVKSSDSPPPKAQP
jgi:hypothetical protein